MTGKTFLPCLTLFFILLYAFSYAKDPSDNYLKSGREWKAKNNPDSAIYYFRKAIRTASETGAWNNKLIALTEIARIYASQGEFEKEYDILRRAMNTHTYDTASNEYFEFFKEYVASQARMEQYESAISSIGTLIHMVSNKNGPRDPYLIKLHSNLGIIYGNLGFMVKSKEIMLKALALAKEIKGENSMEAAEIYNNLGLVYKRTRNYETALIYYNKTYQIVHSLQPGNIRVLAIIRNNIGRLYSAMGKLEKGESMIKTAILLDTTYTNPSLYASYGRNEMERKNYESALENFLISIRVREKRAGKGHPSLSHPMYLAGKAYAALHEFDSALWFFNKAIEMEKKAEKETSEDMALVYTGLADMYEKKGEIRQAISFINKALRVFYKDFKPDKDWKNPAIEMNMPENITVLKILETKGDLFLKLRSRYPDSLDFIRFAYQSYSLAAKLLINYRSMVVDAMAKIQLAGKYREIFEKTISTAFNLTTVDKSEKYLPTAWKMIEANKSFNLRENLNREKIKGLIPDTLTDMEDSIKTLISFYKKKIYIQYGNNTQSEKMNRLHERVFRLSSLLNKIRNRIRIDYPTYYHYLVDQRLASLRDVRKNQLNKKTLIINYFYGDRATYAIGITPDKMAFKKFNNLPGLAGKINDLKSRNINKFVSASSVLYESVAEPVLSGFNGIKNLIIVPDGLLTFIPFEALIRSAPENPKSFSGLPYLIHDYCVTYSSSISLMNYYHPLRSRKPVSLLAFAPDFNRKNNSLLAARSAPDSALFNDLTALPQAEKEAETVAGIFNGICITGRNATESNFKKEISGAGMIHVATHTIIDDKNPLYSRLVFSHSPKSTDDGLLYVYELYHMNINADLVCLSACNTGFGRYYRGEGVISLAQGFLYAGVPNLVMSLWTVADYSTSRIMEAFYRRLAGNVSKSEALRRAKIQYLKQADANTAAPYFWAGFILLKEEHPAGSQAPVLSVSLVSAGVLLFLIFLSIYLKKRRSSGSF